MKIINILFFLFFYINVTAQCIVDVYPVNKFDPCSVDLTKDSNVVVLNPLPFEISYLVEFKGETFINSVQIDRNVDNISLHAYVCGQWILFPLVNAQTFCVKESVQYLLIKYKEDCNKIYLLIE